MKQYKIAVLFSGGLDSSATLFKALEKTTEVLVVFFNYGQNALIQEMKSMQDTCKYLGVDYKVFDVADSLKQFLECSLTNGKTDNGEVGYSSTVPNRNLLFITLLSSYCQLNGISYIFAGFQHLLGKTGEKIKGKGIEDKILNIIEDVDKNIFSSELHPDQRPEFVNSLRNTINLSTGNIKLFTPLFDMDKVDILQYLEMKGELKFVTKNSYTCYNGSKKINFWGKGCGKCTACENRKKAYTIFKTNYGGKI